MYKDLLATVGALRKPRGSCPAKNPGILDSKSSNCLTGSDQVKEIAKITTHNK